MQECGLTQVELAHAMGVSLDRVKSLTSGKVKALKPAEIETLNRGLRVRIEFLLKGKEPVLLPDAEDDEVFAARMQAIAKMNELIAAMPLRQLTKDRLSALMTGDAAKDGVLLANAVQQEALGLDFVTGQPISGAAVKTTLSPDEAALLDNYQHADEEGRIAARRVLSSLAKQKAA